MAVGMNPVTADVVELSRLHRDLSPRPAVEEVEAAVAIPASADAKEARLTEITSHQGREGSSSVGTWRAGRALRRGELGRSAIVSLLACTWLSVASTWIATAEVRSFMSTGEWRKSRNLLRWVR